MPARKRDGRKSARRSRKDVRRSGYSKITLVIDDELLFRLDVRVAEENRDAEEKTDRSAMVCRFIDDRLRQFKTDSLLRLSRDPEHRSEDVTAA